MQHRLLALMVLPCEPLEVRIRRKLHGGRWHRLEIVQEEATVQSADPSLEVERTQCLRKARRAF